MKKITLLSALPVTAATTVTSTRRPQDLLLPPRTIIFGDRPVAATTAIHTAIHTATTIIHTASIIHTLADILSHNTLARLYQDPRTSFRTSMVLSFILLSFYKNFVTTVAEMLPSRSAAGLAPQSPPGSPPGDIPPDSPTQSQGTSPTQSQRASPTQSQEPSPAQPQETPSRKERQKQKKNDRRREKRQQERREKQVKTHICVMKSNSEEEYGKVQGFLETHIKNEAKNMRNQNMIRNLKIQLDQHPLLRNMTAENARDIASELTGFVKEWHETTKLFGMLEESQDSLVMLKDQETKLGIVPERKQPDEAIRAAQGAQLEKGENGQEETALRLLDAFDEGDAAEQGDEGHDRRLAAERALKAPVGRQAAKQTKGRSHQNKKDAQEAHELNLATQPALQASVGKRTPRPTLEARRRQNVNWARQELTRTPARVPPVVPPRPTQAQILSAADRRILATEAEASRVQERVSELRQVTKGINTTFDECTSAQRAFRDRVKPLVDTHGRLKALGIKTSLLRDAGKPLERAFRDFRKELAGISTRLSTLQHRLQGPTESTVKG